MGKMSKPESKYAQHIQKPQTQPLQVDKRLYDTVWAETGGGSPEEVSAVASTFLHNAKSKGYEKSLHSSTAYRRKSKEYVKAETGALNSQEKALYQRNAQIISHQVQNPDKIVPYEKFENVKVFGDPSWAKDMSGYHDIGRQRFYWGEKHGTGN